MRRIINNQQRSKGVEQVNMTKRAFDTFATMGLNGQEEKVERIKSIAGQLWDAIDDISVEPNALGGRYVALAKTTLEESVMWAVKGVS